MQRWEQQRFPAITAGFILLREEGEAVAFLTAAMTWAPLLGDYSRGEVHPREALRYIAQSSAAFWPDRGPTHAIAAVYIPEVSGLFEGTTIMVEEAWNSGRMVVAWDWLLEEVEDED